MTAFDDYYEAEMLARIAQNPNDFIQTFRPEEQMLQMLGEYSCAKPSDVFRKKLLEKFKKNGIFDIISDNISGDFYKISHSNINQIYGIEAGNPESLVFKFNNIGDQLIIKAFDHFNANDIEIDRPVLEQPGLTIPASDRIVTLQHNQQGEIDSQFYEVIDAVEQTNGIDGDGLARQVILGELKAGRELIRAQTFRAYLLYNTVISALGSLIERYRDHAIGAAATRLIELLVEHIFGVK